MNSSNFGSHCGNLSSRLPAHWLAILGRGFVQLLAMPLALGVYLAPLGLVLVACTLLTGWPKTALPQTASCFAALLVGCVALHLVEALAAVRWRQKGCPVVLPDSTARRLLAGPTIGLPLARTTALCAGVLCIAWASASRGRLAATQVLAWGVFDAALAAVMIAYCRLRVDFLVWRPRASAACLPRAPVSLPSVTGIPPLAVPSQPAASAPPPATAPAAQPDYATPVAARKARLAFSGIFGMQDVKDKLLDPARAIVAGTRPAGEPPANGILLHGKPGNGKTVFAEALAGELEVPFVSLTYGDVASKWIGEMPRMISNCFDYAKANAPCVLFIDEIDSFVRSRELGSGSSEDLKITNTLLTEIVAVRDYPVVLIGATNYLANLDAAAVREGRFDLKVEITPPDETARIGILSAAAAKYGAGLEFDPEALVYIAKRWRGYSVSRLTAVARGLPAYVRSQGLRRIGATEWAAALREVQGRANRVPSGSKRLGELALHAPTARALSGIAQRLTDAYRIDSLGGTLPRGVLLHGASGTGRTSTARALAIECGWAFFETNGAKLLADPAALDKLYAAAAEQRPAALFIDDADAVIAARQFGLAPDLVARIEALLRGDEGFSDIVLIAATAHIDRVEPALLRVGRFDEQIELTAPTSAMLASVGRRWLAAKQVRLHPHVQLRQLTESLEGRTFAEVEGILQCALNRAIQRTRAGDPVLLTREDLAAAVKPVASARAQSCNWRLVA